MLLVHFFVYWYLIPHQVSSLVRKSLIQDITTGKPMIVSPNINKYYKHIESGNTSITCKTMMPDAARKKMPIYEIDLENVYPIVMLNISGIGVLNNTVFVRIDKQPCAYFHFPTDLYKWAVLTCEQYRTGRVVSVTTDAEIHICSLRVYTCIAGLQGQQCEEPCSPGTFGAGCVYSCKCRDGRICDASTGFCPTGCQNILADGDFGCIVKKPRIFDTLDMIRLTTSTVLKMKTSPTSYDIGNIIQTRTDEKVSQNCIMLFNSTRLTVTLTYARPVNLEGVNIHHSLNFSLPLHFYLAADGRLCRQATFKSRFPSGSQKYMCQRNGVTGTQVQISYIIPGSHRREIPGLKICQLGILECSKGFYGPRCRISCNCMSTGCDGHTGICLRGMCYMHYRGSNCASFNIAYNKSFKVKYYSKARIDSDLPPYQVDFYYSSKDLWSTWWTIELDEIYEINSITVVPGSHSGVHEMLFEVYSSSAVLDTNIKYNSKEFWRGFPCQISITNMKENVELPCSSVSRSLVLVIYTAMKPDLFTFSDVKIWMCLDGTYGYRCEGICQCKDELETCDKITGACESGCADGYESLFGMGCRPIRKDVSRDNKCHCISGGCPPALGVCTDACMPGWMGVSCNITCPPGTYGSDCTQRCDKCLTERKYDHICTPDSGTCLHGCVDGADCDVQLSQAKPEDSSTMAYSTKVTIITLVICAIIILFGGFVCKFFWMKLNKDDEELYRFKELTMKREVAKEVSEQILREHMDYHENYLKRDILFKAQDELVDNIQQAEHMSDKLIKKGTFELKKPSIPKIEQKPAGQGKPLGQDHEQQDADVKVALWVLSQNFDEFIQRRKERLANYQGNILEIQESIYSIPKIDIEEDIHDLYDEIAPLELP